MQQWAPLRLSFRDPGPVERVELFCAAAGPRFLAFGRPAPAGESLIDLAVYSQLQSSAWVVRLIDADGRSRDFDIDLGVDFSPRRPTVELPADRPAGGSVFTAPPVGMVIAAARSLRAPADDPAAIAFLAGGGELELLAPDGGVSRLSLSDTFGPPHDSPLVDEAFYRTVWTEELSQWPPPGRRLVLAVLAGGLLAVAAVGLIVRRRAVLASLLAGGVMAATAGGLWLWLRAAPTALTVEMEIVTRPGQFAIRNSALGTEDRGAVAVVNSEFRVPSSEFPVPVRRQRWLCLAAHRAGRYEVRMVQPSARMVVADLAERPNVVLPAAWRTDEVWIRMGGQPGWIELERGWYRAFDSTELTVGGGAVVQHGESLAWRNWRVPLRDAWFVADTRAIRLGPVQGSNGQAALAAERVVAWDTAWQADPADGLEAKLAKRLLRYWSTRPNPPRGGRRWLVGWSARGTGFQPVGGHGQDAHATATDGRLVLPDLHVIDLGPIRGDFPWDSSD